MEALAGDLREMQRTPLYDSHVEAIREIAETRSFEAGEIVAEAGTAMDQFMYIIEGEVEVLDPFTRERGVPSTLGPTQFLGDITLLTGGNWSLPMRAIKETRVLAARRDDMLKLMAGIPEMSDIILTVYAARRRRMLEDGRSSLKLIGADRDAGVQRIASFASRNRIPYDSYDLDSKEASDAANECELAQHGPAVIYGRDRVVESPTPRKVAELLGMDLDLRADCLFDLLIVGGGPSGVAAAVYAGAEGLTAVVVEDLSIGGQAGTSSRIENYMGFPTGISGADLVWRGQIQAMKFGTRFAVPRRVVSLSLREDGSFLAGLDSGQEISAKAVLVATGVQYRRLPLDRLEDFEGAGVYYAATEMEARFCKNTEAVVIGGGNSAGQAAMFLSRYADHVHVLVRGRSLAASMSSYLSNRLEADPRITLRYETQVVGLNGDASLESVDIDGPDGAETIATSGLFVMVGAAPNTEWLEGLVALDDKGFVKSGEAATADDPFATSQAGIFAVGDVRAGSVKRVASAVGEGSVVVSRIWEYVRPDE